MLYNVHFKNPKTFLYIFFFLILIHLSKLLDVQSISEYSPLDGSIIL